MRYKGARAIPHYKKVRVEMRITDFQILSLEYVKDGY